jgi:N-methylhydantoinase A
MLFAREIGLIETPLLRRAELSEPIAGPIAIEEPDTTIIVPPGSRASLDRWGNVRIDIEGQAGRG